jgi:hypothetical protein
VPAFFRGEDGGFDLLCAMDDQDPGCFDDADPIDLLGDLIIQFDTSHDNKYIGNRMGLDPNGSAAPNGIDHWWDEGGQGNCWEQNVYIDDAPRQDPMADAVEYVAVFPQCGELDPTQAWRPPHPRLLTIVPCNDYSWPDNTHPDGCEWMTDPEAPA